MVFVVVEAQVVENFDRFSQIHKEKVMTDFRIKFLGLAAVATLFAGVSFGQNTTLSCPGQLTPGGGPNLYTSILASTNGTAPQPASPLLLRAEGTTELVSDLVLTNCTNNSGISAASASVIVFMSQPVTSKVINAAGTPPPTEATLIVSVPGGAVATYSGSISGNTVTFTNIAFPTTFNLEVADIRVNATGTGATTSPVAVTESLFAGFNGQSTISISAQTVGTALQSLATPAFAVVGNSNVVNNLVICTGNTVSSSSGLASTTVGFQILMAETLGGFFKSGVPASGGTGIVPNTEYGTYVNTTTGAGVPAAGTRIQLVMSGVPAAATVYVPLTITSQNGTAPNITTATAQLTSSTTGGFSAVAASTTAGLPANIWGSLTPNNGVVTAVYEITTSTPGAINSFNTAYSGNTVTVPGVQVYITFTANSVTASQVTVLESYAPTGSTEIPNFAASAATPLNASAILPCVTNLLFPFVTSQLGFDTGLAISNASADPFGRFGAVPPGTTAPAGACTLNYYGAGAPSPSAVATPSIASGTTYAFVNSSVAPGFQGYVIVQCPFVGGHGFGFVTNLGSAGNSAVAQGYNALSLPAANSGGTKRIFPTTSTTESVGQ
jgi:hypothetical protein